MPVKCGRGPHLHATITDVQACYNGEDVDQIPMSQPESDPHWSEEDLVSSGMRDKVADPLEPKATGKQISFLCSLADQKEAPETASRTKALAVEGHWGKRSISAEINRLKALPRLPAERTGFGAYGQAGSAPDFTGKATESHGDGQTPVALEAGMYRMDEAIYKVQRNVVQGDGSRAYAKRLTKQLNCRICGYTIWDDGIDTLEAHETDYGHAFSPKWKFEYEQGAVQKLRPKMRLTLEEAKAFGKVYGTCCVCGRTLTNETSIEEGIGPICGGRV